MWIVIFTPFKKFYLFIRQNVRLIEVKNYAVSLSYCIVEKRFKLKFSDSKMLIPEIMP